MKQVAIKVRREVPFGQENAGTVLSEDVIVVNDEHEMALKHGAEPLLTFKLLTQDQRHPGRTFPGVELRLTGPGGVIMQADSVRAYLLAKFKGADPDGWTDVIGGDGDNAYRLVGDQMFRLQFRAVELSLPADWDEEEDDGESLAFDLTFDPAQLCAVCVAGLNPPNVNWGVKAYGPDDRLIDTRDVEITAKWARELIDRGGEIRTPDNHKVPLYAATLYRGTPLCEYDITPAMHGRSIYKF